MPRPPRCRRICGKPQIDTFCPNGGGSGTPILLTLDEYEVIRLVDLEQRTHEQCAAQMDISRSTVQEIYESARQKIAACLVHGKPLRITGGNYRICGGEEHPHCGRSCRLRTFNESDHKQKGEPDMKIAVTYENGQIFQHFGHTEQFKLYEVADGKIVREEVVDTNGSGRGYPDLRRYRRRCPDGTGGGRYQALRRRQRRSGRSGERPAGKRACIRSQRPL